MHQVYLLTGSNMEQPEKQVRQAYAELEKNIGHIITASGLYATAAWGMMNQADFINQAICLETKYSPREVLEKILAIENYMGRKRIYKMGPRIIDIDILLYDTLIIHEQGLTIPHPLLTQRRFALAPLEEIAAMVMHPVLKKKIHELLMDCKDDLDVYKISTE